jgi:hypothetical protein
VNPIDEHNNAPDHLAELLSAATDGWLVEETRHELTELLRRDSRARAAYIEHAIVQAMLTRKHCNRGVESLPSPFDYAPTFPMGIAEPEVSPAMPVGGGAWPGACGYVSSGWPVAYLIATVVLGLGLVIGSVIHAPQSNQIVRQSDTLPSLTLRSVVGRITGMVDCVWESSQLSAISGQQLQSTSHQPLATNRLVSLGDRFVLHSGLVEITYDTGARVILQGPVTYKVDSAVGGYLAVGKLTAKLENRGDGRGESIATNPPSTIHHPTSSSSSLSTLHSPLFTITTPTAIITDLGTEFGAEVGADGTTRSYVFQGSVKLEVIGDSKAREPRRVILTANQSATVRPRSEDRATVVIQRHNVNPNTFVQTMHEQHWRSGNDYARLVLGMNPAVYYQMEQPVGHEDESRVFDSAPDGYHGRLFSDASRPWLSGRFGASLLFRQPGGVSVVVVPDYPKATQNRLSVSAWVMATDDAETDWNFIVANWRFHEFGQFHFGLRSSGSDLGVAIAQRDRTLLVVREGPEHPFPMNVWQHVAFVCDGRQLRLYRNGAMVASAFYNCLYLNPKVSPLAIGGRLSDNSDTVVESERECWRGRIDELAIFNHALTSEQVRQLSGTAISDGDGAHQPMKKHKP